MNDQLFRDTVCLILIGVVVYLEAQGHSVSPQLQQWADTAFGFLFGFKTAGYMIGKQDSGAKNGNITQENTGNPGKIEVKQP